MAVVEIVGTDKGGMLLIELPCTLPKILCVEAFRL